MKYISHVAVLLLGGAITAGGFLMLSPPSKLDLAIEAGRKLGLAGAEARYATYEAGHAVLLGQVEEAEKRTEAAESSLKAFRASSVSEGRRLKKIEQGAIFAQDEARQEQAALEEALDSSWETLESVTASSDQGTQEAVADVKMAFREIHENCVVQLVAANQEGGALRLQLDLKDQEIVALSASRNSWKDLAEKEEYLRKDAESYIRDVKDSGFYFGVGVTGGYSKLLSGASGPGGTIGFSTGWRF